MRTKRIYYLATTENTYMRRHDLYNAGVRWDAKKKQWWGHTLAAVRKAAEMVGGDATVEAVHVQKLPNVSKTHRGGRPRATRKMLKVERTARLKAPAQADGKHETHPLLAVGTPFVRGRAEEDRRKQPERRNEETRPEAVLVVPMAAEETLQQA
jgi:hypothetical protein